MWRNQRVLKRESAAAATATAISRNSIVKRDLFTNLPQEIGIDIFSRLPFKTIMKCKCVCKAWLHLLSTREFVDYHYTTKSVPGLILSEEDEAAWKTSRRYEILEFVDSGRRPCKTVYGFSVHRSATLHSSANGLLLFLNYKNQNLMVCNPVLTREYINLPPPTQSSPYQTQTQTPRWCYSYGFGVSKVSGEYKVVRISTCPTSPYKYKFEVYTLGTGSWRSIAVGGGDDAAALPYDSYVFVDGNLYSLSSVKDSCINCFDLETEVLSTVSCPSSRGYETYNPHLCALEGRLCLCLNDFDELVIWVMHQVGYWTKEFEICKAKLHDRYRCDTFSAIKVLGDREMLLVREGVGDLYYYSRKCDTLEPISFTCRKRRHLYRVGYTPRFLPLNTFAIENVCSF